MRGAKAHTSGSVVAKELIVIPTRAMREEDADYAVAFAIPVDAPGHQARRRGFNAGSDSELEAPVSSHDELMETFTIFDDVFVPWERVFLCGEWQHAGDVANTFASVNRQGYLGADVGKLRLFIGAAQRIAELNGVARARPHPREDHADDPDGALDLGARGRRLAREPHARAATRSPIRC